MLSTKGSIIFQQFREYSIKSSNLKSLPFRFEGKGSSDTRRSSTRISRKWSGRWPLAWILTLALCASWQSRLSPGQRGRPVSILIKVNRNEVSVYVTLAGIVYRRMIFFFFFIWSFYPRLNRYSAFRSRRRKFSSLQDFQARIGNYFSIFFTW